MNETTDTLTAVIDAVTRLAGQAALLADTYGHLADPAETPVAEWELTTPGQLAVWHHGYAEGAGAVLHCLKALAATTTPDQVVAHLARVTGNFAAIRSLLEGQHVS